MTPDEAVDEIFTMLNTSWLTNSLNVVEQVPEILWQGRSYGAPPVDACYARASVKHNTSLQTSLASDVGTRRFTRYGIVLIQVHVPIGIRNPLTTARKLGKIALDVFEGRSSPGGIWFRNCRLNEIDPTDGWQPVNVVAEFSYDEVK